MPHAASGLGAGPEWRSALDEAIGAARLPRCDLALLFVSSHFREHEPEILATVRNELSPGLLVGCSGQAVIGRCRELEGEPAISLLALDLPGVELRHFRLRQEDIFSAPGALAWYRRTGLAADEVNGWLAFSDPFSFDSDALLAALDDAYPRIPLVGGLASAEPARRTTSVYLNGQVFEDGAVLVAVGGAWSVEAVVSQGAAPIGQTWTITDVERNVIRAIGGRPPLEVLIETMRALAPDVQQRASRNVLVGLAMNEYRDDFQRGDFLIRNLVGVDQESGAIAVGARPRPGQTLQFQMRDADAADDELRHMLDAVAAKLEGGPPGAALLCACNGRGAGLFGRPHHDAAALDDRFDGLPVAGFFCNGELGPVGDKNFVHGFTASIGFIVPRR